MGTSVKGIQWLMCIWLLCHSTIAGATGLELVASPVSTAVQGIGRSYGLQIVGIDTLEGNVTARLGGDNPVDWIRQLGKVKGFYVHQEGNVIIVDGRAKVEPTEVFVIQPKHISVPQLVEPIQQLVPHSMVTMVKEKNQLLVRASPRDYYVIQQALQSMDIPSQQVRVETTIIALERSYAKELGLQWTWLPITSSSGDTSDGFQGVRLSHSKLGNPFFVKGELAAMESSGRAALIARPTIMTMNGEESKILIGERIPVLEESDTDDRRRTTVRYEDTGIRLQVLPYIGADNTIDVTLDAEVSSPTLVPEVKAYKITSRLAHTRVRLAPGEVYIIGGLMDNRTQYQHKKVPFLGDIPLLGKLFQHSRKTKDEVELFIVVRAFVV